MKTTVFSFHTKSCSEKHHGWNYGVRLWAGVLATSCTCSASVSSLQPSASKSRYILVSQIQLTAVGFYELLAEHQPFLSVTDLQTAHIFITLQKLPQCSSVWKALSSCPAKAGTALSASLPVSWIPQKYNFVIKTLLWLPG